MVMLNLHKYILNKEGKTLIVTMRLCFLSYNYRFVCALVFTPINQMRHCFIK